MDGVVSVGPIQSRLVNYTVNTLAHNHPYAMHMLNAIHTHTHTCPDYARCPAEKSNWCVWWIRFADRYRFRRTTPTTSLGAHPLKWQTMQTFTEADSQSRPPIHLVDAAKRVSKTERKTDLEALYGPHLVIHFGNCFGRVLLVLPTTQHNIIDY